MCEGDDTNLLGNITDTFQRIAKVNHREKEKKIKRSFLPLHVGLSKKQMRIEVFLA